MIGKIKIWGTISDSCYEFAFATCIYCMKLTGIWPYGGKFLHFKFLQCLVANAFVTMTTAIAIPTAPNRIEVLRRIMNCAISLAATIKLVVYKFNGKKLKILLNDVACDWDQYPFISRKHKIMVTRFMNIGRCIHFVTIVFTEIPTIYFSYRYVINFYDFEKINEDESYIIYPRDLKNHPYYLVILYLVEMYCVQICAIFLITMDSFFCIIVLHAIAQAQLLNDTLAEYKGQMHTNQYGNVDTCKCIKCIFSIHDKIIRFASHLEETFNVLLLIDFTRYLFSYCSLIYCLSMFYSMDNTSGVMEFFLYIIIINFSTFVPCFFSHYVTEVIGRINSLAYNTNWPDYNKEQCDCILLMILRSQKPTNITAGKLFVINRTTYKNMVTMAISYASVLLALK